MAGLNFQTQTIINSNLDPDSGKELFISGGSAGDSFVKILRDFVFYRDKANYGKTLRVVLKDGHAATMCSAAIDFDKILQKLVVKPTPEKSIIPETYCRLDVYLGVEGAEPFIYSTPWVQKGKPFWLEFTIPAHTIVESEDLGKADITAFATKVAADVVKEIKKSHMFQVDKDLLTVSSSAAVLTLTGANEYQRLRNVEIMVYEANEDSAKSIAKLSNTSSDPIALKARGANGFGTYSQIVKDLRLPTAANWQPYHVRNVETPILDAIYDQFIIDYEAPATNEGLGCVGQRLQSVTTHVFWVKHDIAGAFNTAVAKLLAEGPLTATKPEAIETKDVEDDVDMSNAKAPKPSGVNHPKVEHGL